MTRMLIGMLFVLASMTSLTSLADQPREVKLDELTLQVPEGWKQQPPSNTLRLGQFEIPAAEGDAQPAELSIFSFGAGGTVQQQVDRWVGQFEPGGRKFEAARGVAPQGEYVLVDLQGTYKEPVGPPVLQQTRAVPNSRMLVVMLTLKNSGHYFLKLVGPEKTVTDNLEGFRTAFGADKQSEKPLEEKAS